MITVGAGIAPESDIGVFGILGYDPKEEHPGRGVLEAMGIGMDFRDGELAYRINFATADWPEIGHMYVRSGTFLPRDDLHAPRSLAVLGSKAKEELFGNTNPLGKQLVIGGSRFRVIGVMEPKGNFVGMDVDDTVFIPTARALELFNREGLTGDHETHDPDASAEEVVAGIRRAIAARHGRDDIAQIGRAHV